MAIELGRLDRISLREAWQSEASDFTPWLAQEDNLKLLGETLGLDLELEATEQNVGPFRADILCKDLNRDQWVLIENQLECTDHTHLGQLITYASGLEAVTLIWIADRFTEQHRAAVDWLNEITNEQFNIFGIEVELWRIGDSKPAPQFNIIAKPNDWSKSVSRAAREISSSGVTEHGKLREQYWDQLGNYLREHSANFSLDRKTAASYVDFPLGISGVAIVAYFSRTKSGPGVFLRLQGAQSEALFNLLQSDAGVLSSEIGSTLSWREAKPHENYHIGVNLPDPDPTDTERWPRLIKWTAEMVEKFRAVFLPRIGQLNPDDWSPAE